MIAADLVEQRSAKLLIGGGDGVIRHLPRAALASLFNPGDLVVANDAATLPASLTGIHYPSGRPIEVRLAAWISAGDLTQFIAIAFGAGDYRTRTEDRRLRHLFRRVIVSRSDHLPRPSDGCLSIPVYFECIFSAITPAFWLVWLDTVGRSNTPIPKNRSLYMTYGQRSPLIRLHLSRRQPDLLSTGTLKHAGDNAASV